VPRMQVGDALDRATNSDRLKRVFLRADKTVPYGELMRVMNLLRAAGYLKVALVGLEGTEVQSAPGAPPDAASPVPAAPTPAPPATP